MMDGTGSGVILGLLIVFYLIPTFVAGGRRHRNAGAIFALNFLLGWSVIGWIIALVWACTNDVIKNEKV